MPGEVSRECLDAHMGTTSGCGVLRFAQDDRVYLFFQNGRDYLFFQDGRFIYILMDSPANSICDPYFSARSKDETLSGEHNLRQSSSS